MAWVFDQSTNADRDPLWASRFAANEMARLDAWDNKKAIRVRVYPPTMTAAEQTARRQVELAQQDKAMAEATAQKVGLVAEFNAMKDAADPAITFDPQSTGNAWFTGSYTLRGVVVRVSRANERDARRAAILKQIELDYRVAQLDSIRVSRSTDPSMDNVVNTPNGVKTRRQVLLEDIASRLASKEAEKAERIRDVSTLAP